jgi:four helix bundle protein
MEKFKQLKVYEKAHRLTLQTYRVTAHYPPEEKYGLVSQMRRAAVSVVANITEGTKRKTVADRRHFHVIADGSLEELKYYFLLSTELGYISEQQSQELLTASREVGAMLNALTEKL